MEEKSLYLECNAGISGDMAVAALLDAGASRSALEEALNSLNIEGFRTEIKRVKKNSIDCQDFNVILDTDNHDHDMEYLFGHLESEHSHNKEEEHTHNAEHHEHHHNHHESRGIAEINAIIDGAKMTDGARELCKKIFTILAESEAKAHGVQVSEVHFHEVGALDSIVDIIALAVCFDSLNITNVYVPYLCEGEGTVRCQHGLLSIPVPAVSNILSSYKIPLSPLHQRGEFVTPTGAAFVAAVRTHTTLPSSFVVQKIGLGAGKRTYEVPSILRAFIITEEHSAKKIYKLETNIDDSTGEQLGFVMNELFNSGAHDVFYTPCFMKKNRPAYILSVICDAEHREALESIIFCHTTTVGIRRFEYERTILPRFQVKVKTKWGEAEAKGVTLPTGEARFYPEYESAIKLAKENNVSYEDAFLEIKRACKEL